MWTPHIVRTVRRRGSGREVAERDRAEAALRQARDELERWVAERTHERLEARGLRSVATLTKPVHMAALQEALSPPG